MWARLKARTSSGIEVRPFRVAVVVPTLVLFLLVSLTNPRFAGPDDVYYHLSLNGTLWSEPVGDLVVVRPLLTDPLVWLYRWAEHVPWYIGLHLAMQLAAWMLLLYAFLAHRASQTLFGWAMAAAVAIGIGLRLWMTMQYSSTAALLISAGIALHASSGEPDRWSTRAAVAGVAVGIGGLLRSEMVPVLLLVAGPWLAFGRPPLERKRAHACFLAVAAAITAIGWVHQQAKYEGNEAWAQYLDYNATRGTLSDSPGLDDFPGVSPAMAARGWSDNDVVLLTRFSMIDPVVFSKENMRALSDELADSRRSIGLAIEKIEVTHPLLFLTGAVVGLVAVVTTDRRSRWILVASGGIAAVLLSYAALDLHMPFYVPASVVFSLAAMAVFQPPPERRRVALGAAVLLGVVAVAGAADLAISNDRNNDQSARTIAYLEELDQLDPDGTFFLQAPDVLRLVGPLELQAIPDIDMFFGSWFVASPQYEQRVASLGDGSVMDIVLADPHVYIITDSTRIVNYETFVDEHIDEGSAVVTAHRFQFDADTELVALTGRTP